MKKVSLLPAALALVLLPMSVALVQAQAPSRVPRGGVENPETQTNKQKKAAAAAAAAAAKEVQLFPMATRQSPAQIGSPAVSKEVATLFALKDANTPEDELIAKADAIIANPKAMPFDKSAAGYIAAYAWQAKDTDHYTNAIKYIEGAINDNGLSNNTHYQLMLQLAQILQSEEKYAEALTYADRYLAETKSDDQRAYTIKAQVMLATDKPEAAAAALEQLLVKKPNDKKLMWNLISVYSQAGNDAKAGQMFDKLRSAGLLTENKDYDMAFRLLANLEGRDKDAMAVIDEGLKKGILVPTTEVYSFQGLNYYQDEKFPQAIEAWSKGAPLAKNGELYLNVAKLQVEQSRWAEAKAAAKSAMDKGVKRTGDVWQIIARAETGLGNKAAAKAATLEAVKYPETKKWAEAALRQTSGK